MTKTNLDEVKLDANKIPKQSLPKDGDWVMFTNCAESKQKGRKIYKVDGHPFRSSGGEIAVMLEGYSGYFLAKYVKVINIETIPILDQLVRVIDFREDDDWDNYTQYFNMSVAVRHRKDKIHLAIGVQTPDDEVCGDCGYYRSEGRGD